MENKSKLNTVLLIIIIILLVIGLGYFFLRDSKENENTDLVNNLPQEEINNLSQENKESLISEKSEESDNEIFVSQPGTIKSIVVNKDEDGFEKGSWTLSVDLLSSNPNWLPGIDSTGGFFLNKNPKIRNLNISSATKIVNCGAQMENYGSGFSGDLLSFINYAQNRIDDLKNTAEFGYTAYFDIEGTNITAVYEQCLP